MLSRLVAVTDTPRKASSRPSVAVRRPLYIGSPPRSSTPSRLVSSLPSALPLLSVSSRLPMSGGPKRASLRVGRWPFWMSTLPGLLCSPVMKPMVNAPVSTPSVFWPSALIFAPAPTKASTRLVTTGTPTAAPIPAEPPADNAPAMLISSSRSLAAIAIEPRACRSPAPKLATASPGSSPMNARVTIDDTITPTDAAMPAEPPAPIDAAICSAFSLESASTCTSPRTLPVAAEPIEASVSLLNDDTATPAVAPAEPP